MKYYTILQLSYGKTIDEINIELAKLFEEHLTNGSKVKTVGGQLLELINKDVIIPESSRYDDNYIDNELLNISQNIKQERKDNLRVSNEMITPGKSYDKVIVLITDSTTNNIRAPKIEDIEEGVTTKPASESEKLANSLKKLIVSVNEKIPKLIDATELRSRKKQANLLPKLKQSTYSEIVELYGKSNVNIPDAYRSFMMSLSNFRAPIRQTTNYKLQQLIDGKDETVIIEFFSFMDRINNQYMEGEPTTAKPIDINLLNAGMSQINMNSTSAVRREIYVMVDLINGEINDKNKGSIYCPYYGQYLGKEFVALTRSTRSGKVNRNAWKVDRNRMIFTLSNTSAKGIDEKPIVLDAKPLPISKNIEDKPNVAFPTTSKDDMTKIRRSDIDNLFLIKLRETRDITNVLNKSLNNINTIATSLQLSETNLLEYIRSNNGELYNYIKKWSINPNEKNNDLIGELIQLKNKYKGIEESTDRKIKSSTTRLFGEELTKEQLKKELYILYQHVVELLIRTEEKKIDVIPRMGGSNSSSRKMKRRIDINKSKNSRHTRRYRK